MKTTPTAAQTEYALRQANSQRLLAAIDKALKAHAIKAAGDPRNWGYAGDIGAAEIRLQEVLDAFGG